MTHTLIIIYFIWQRYINYFQWSLILLPVDVASCMAAIVVEPIKSCQNYFYFVTADQLRLVGPPPWNDQDITRKIGDLAARSTIILYILF